VLDRGTNPDSSHFLPWLHSSSVWWLVASALQTSRVLVCIEVEALVLGALVGPEPGVHGRRPVNLCLGGRAPCPLWVSVPPHLSWAVRWQGGPHSATTTDIVRVTIIVIF
jgi:hypothetical protein